MDFCSVFIFMYMASTYKVMALQLNDKLDDRFLTILGSIGAIFNGCSRTAAGILMDRYPFKNIYAVLLTTQLIVACTMTTVVQYSPNLYFLWVIIAYNCVGPHFVLFPTEMVKTYGVKSGSKLYSFIYIALGTS